MPTTHPLLLELNTRCWLRELTAAEGREVSLSTVPERLFEKWKGMGLTHVWLMGVWCTGPRSRERALANGFLREELDRVLPGWDEEDVAGSPYAIERHVVAEVLGGMEGLRRFRRRLNTHGLRLVLDFVPNHVGLDHPWLQKHPDYFVQTAEPHPAAFSTRTGDRACWILHGRDPHFAAWDDTAQLDHRRSDLQQALLDELLQVAQLCDGVRCDMAMLVLRDVFERTWEDIPVTASGAGLVTRDFWDIAIPAVKAIHGEFLFIAEVYWNLEERLQAVGFDYTYDKILTDGLLRHHVGEMVTLLQGRTPEFLNRSVHFLENHDEVRVASALSIEEHRAAALLTLGLPGMRFLHDGQTLGATLRTPVQLRRRAAEPVDHRIRDLYAEVLGALQQAGVGHGDGRLLRAQPAWADNPTSDNFVVIQWSDAHSPRALVVVNLADHRSQCRVSLEWAAPGTDSWQLVDLLSDERWTRSADDLRDRGLFLDVPAHAAQVFLCQPADPHSGARGTS